MCRDDAPLEVYINKAQLLAAIEIVDGSRESSGGVYVRSLPHGLLAVRSSEDYTTQGEGNARTRDSRAGLVDPSHATGLWVTRLLNRAGEKVKLR